MPGAEKQWSGSLHHMDSSTCGHKNNGEADKLAKEIAARVDSRVVEADNSISVPADIAINTWQR